jgi:2-dehydro-3-deoxyphosphogluconate aldolase/(4S)-4-hydroxy-2-oxoglutarate aldolase
VEPVRANRSAVTLHSVWDRPDAVRVLPVIGALLPRHAPALVAAFADAGVRAVEITLRDPQALAALRAAAQADAGVAVGAGTVCNPGQMEAALDAGATFAVSPGFDSALTRHAIAIGVPYLPGVATASEVMAARELGLRLLKFFPAEAMGGVATLRALAGPFPDVAFIPTGGVGAANLRGYLQLPTVRAVGGSWLVSAEELAAGDFSAVAGRVTAARGA